LNFVLVPFHAIAPIDQIHGSIERRGTQLIVEFRLPLGHGIHWPNTDSLAERRSGLWESTCFECFIGLADADTYIEANISPAGQWQAFEFETYRAVALPSPKVLVSGQSMTDTETSPHTNNNDPFQMNCTIDVEHPSFVTSDWHIAPATVLEDRQGRLHYYALSHSGERPDFHLAATRTLLLPLRVQSLSG
jgi:hypothetical protein